METTGTDSGAPQDARAQASGDAQAEGAGEGGADGGGAEDGGAAPEDGGGSGSLDLTLTQDGSTILIGDTWRECAADEDCATVSTSCDGCCGEDAISVERVEAYREQRDQLCAGYQGGVCDCVPRPAVTECVAGRCERNPRQDSCPPCVPPPPGCVGTGPCGCGPYECEDGDAGPQPTPND